MKKSYIFKRIIAALLAIATAACLCACGDGNQGKTDDNQPVKLSFKEAAGYDYLKTLDGKQVVISGYMATSSPVDGSFLFLMNLPYQSCPFCKPNTSQLSNTMEVYPKKSDSFEGMYTTQAIRVTGTLVVAESEDASFTDRYGYEFNYKIVDATFKIISAEELSSEMALWQKIANTSVIAHIYKMYDYTNFLCAWNTYYVSTYTDKNGKLVKGYYLYPQDALGYLQTSDAQWNYGYKDGYFEDLIAEIRKVDPTAFEDLVENVEKAKVLAEKALKELTSGNYTNEYKYIEQFDNWDYVYTLTNGDALLAEWESIYYDFADWLGGWEM